VERAGIAYPSRDALLRALVIVKPKVKHLSDVPDWISFLFTEDYPFEESSLEKALRKPGALERLQTLGEALKNLPEWTHASIEAKLKETAAALGVKAGVLVHPARVAVTGKSIGPGLYETLEILGRERALARFKRTAELATQKFAPTGSA
jgi:glutamyl-tRNA synthetase